MVTGTIHNQIKMMMNNNMWQKKKNDINSGKMKELTPEERMIEYFEEQAASERERRGTNDIYTKLQSGTTLTAEEIEYLRKNDPNALKDYENAQNEKKAYKEALKNCKTKEEVERLKVNRMGQFLSETKSIANSPYIPVSKKEELLKKLNNEMCLINKVTIEFYESGGYAKLPDEEELREREAKDETGITEDIEGTENTENTDDAEIPEMTEVTISETVDFADDHVDLKEKAKSV